MRNRRSGFTLIEILVVVTIIAVLAALSLKVIGSTMDLARDASTKTTLNKIQGLLNSRAQALDRLQQRNGYLTGSTEFTQFAVKVSGGDTNLQQIVARKLLQIKYFPQSRADFKSLYGGTIQQIYPNLNPGGSVFLPGSPNLSNEEILYDFLTQENVIGGVPIGSDAFNAAEVQDKNGNGLPEFIDGWGTPIRFYRWPTHLFRASTGAAIDPTIAKKLFSTLPAFSGNLTNDLARDPDDPLQSTLAVDTNMNQAGYFETNYHTPVTFHVFLVVSAGADQRFGMDSPDTGDALGKVTDSAALEDDILYLNIRAGGK